MKKVATVLLLFLTIILISFLGLYIYIKMNYSAVKESSQLFIKDGLVQNQDLLMIDNDMYISEECIKNNELIDLYWDEDYNRINIYYDYEHKIISYNVDNAFYNGNEYKVQNVLKLYSGNLYLNADFLQSEFIDNMFIDKESQNIIIGKADKVYKAFNKCNFYKWTSFGEKINTNINENQEIYVYDNRDSRFYCLTQNGDIGYINKDDVYAYKSIVEYSFSKPARMPEVTLAWDLVSRKVDTFKKFEIPDVLDVIAPTWYELNNTEDIFNDYSQDEYIDYVHSMNKEIWATFNNSFDKELTNKLLNNPNKRDRIVAKIINIIKEKNFDGINIDFENVYMKDSNVFSAFIKELYIRCLSENITMSVDVAVLSSSETWSRFYDRKAIGLYSDYVFLMAYDQHVSGESGSVGSIPWIEYGVQNLLESVDEGKVALAVPFYTRLWEEKNDNGIVNVKSTSLKIKTAINVLNNLDIELKYDEETGQNYGEKIVDGVLCRVWNEDDVSMKNRMHIIYKYNLVGKGVWAFDYGTDEIWDCLK